jgi:hypothetical protein
MPSVEAFTAHFKSLLFEPDHVDPHAIADILDKIKLITTWGTYPLHDVDTLRCVLKNARALEADAHGVSHSFRITEHNIWSIFTRLSNNKAVGIDMLSAECFKYARDDVLLNGRTIPKPNKLVLSICMKLFNSIIETGVYPDSWCDARITPIYKGKGEIADTNSYRGIAIMSNLAKCFACVIESKLSQFLEDTGNRHLVQSGFRRKVGTTHNLFVLNHLQSMHCIEKSSPPLYVCFVDFVKAFDKVHREILWQRLASLGLTGPLLTAIKAMYSDVRLRVKLNGKLGEVFDSLLGVKQGDPLSPVLFGAFIEVMPEFIEALNALSIDTGGFDFLHNSPNIDGLALFCMLFADDLTLVSRCARSMQCLLDAVHKFCALFHMEFSSAKSEVIIFNSCSHKLKKAQPNPPLVYNGTPLNLVKHARYLGVVFEHNGKFSIAKEQLIGSATRASFALKRNLILADVNSPAAKIYMFNSLVRPIFSYGCQVWGVDYLKLPDRTPLNARDVSTADLVPHSPFETLWVNFLRATAGVPVCTPIWTLMQELNVLPVQCHFAACVLRFWNEMIDKPYCMAARAFKSDLKLMLRKNRSCWTFKVVEFLVNLGNRVDHIFIKPDHAAPFTSARRFSADAYDYFCDYRVDVIDVLDKLRLFWFHQLARCRLTSPRTTLYLPRFAAYMAWAGTREVDVPDYTSMVLPTRARNSYMRLRLGAWYFLAVNRQRYSGAKTNRKDRACPHCKRVLKRVEMEDELHVLLECPLYADIRTNYRLKLPFPAGMPTDDDMRAVLNFGDQRSVVLYVHALYLKRVKLEKPQG